ncbi:hemerythrin domain-containing protein [Saccharicrinis fermentans]|uniref:Hemerythrin-like domain-containing protein n=1 Tax=Saccharicrinis fermentans DSM 9555 = JCM 21142 TaxID=869213 RepID=W7YR45_9BACT|nr:hemerythrin domain-containing protein [Saccharicrinis fermentans]GAF04909.1 hypothetical protein JCM21142_93631 [Saccharicrinis fermentans DSM 9555 = JCM 21142]
MNTQRYRKQHEDILGAIDKIDRKLDVEMLMFNAREVRLLISGLFGKLKFHLSIEDKVIYPTLLRHEDSNIAHTAQRFFDEMGDIVDLLNSYDKRWSNEHKIKERPLEFMDETQAIFKKLVLRTNVENKELYALVDELP